MVARSFSTDFKASPVPTSILGISRSGKPVAQEIICENEVAAVVVVAAAAAAAVVVFLKERDGIHSSKH